MAKEYYNDLKKREGVKVNMDLYKTNPHSIQLLSSLYKGTMVKDVVNRKHVLLKRSHRIETDKVSAIEFPVVYNQRFSTVFTPYGDGTPVDPLVRQEIFKGSFDRLLIYRVKETGETVHRLITFVPDIDYLRKHGNDISHNHVSQLDSDFDGFLVYKDWKDDRPIYLLRIDNGKTTGYKSMRIQTNDNNTNPSNLSRPGRSQSKANLTNPNTKVQAPSATTAGTMSSCWVYFEEEWGESCVTAGPEEYESTNCTPYLISSTPITVCDYTTGDPCYDYGDCLTGDPCQDFGACGGTGGGGDGTAGLTEAQIAASLDTTMTAAFYNNARLKCIMARLMDNNSYKKSINAFTNENNTIDLHFKIEPLTSPPGYTKYGETQPNPRTWNSNDIDITINSLQLNSLSSLEVAALLLHEGIHAELFRILLSVNGPSGLTSEDFPDLFDFYAEYKGVQSPQHQLMAEHYVNVIGTALYNFDDHQFSLDHYKSLAWGGLEETDAYIALSASEKSDIATKTSQVLANRQTTNCND